ncbi:MAG: radical SAM protein [Thermoanaerobaculia bacterium]|nr:radical SAM protein [Thermoanaerobaculia bacterium]
MEMIPERLLTSPRTDAVHLSTTGRCNLRCVYCEVSAPGYVGSDFDFSSFDGVIALLVERGVKAVSFYGEGETTFVPGWERHLASLQGAGLRTAMVTNLARRLTPSELEVLLSVDDLYVSCDTTDSDVFRKTRTGSVAVLLQNMVELQGLAIARTGRAKDLTWHCVLNTMSCRTLVPWVASGLALGVARFSLGQLLPKAHNQQVACITSLPDEEFRDCARLVEEAEALAKRHGRKFEFQAGFAEVLRARGAALARESGVAG